MCVWEFASCVEKKAEGPGRRSQGNSDRRYAFLSDHPQSISHSLRIRDVAHVPILAGPRIPRADRSAEEKTIYHRAMLLLFKPWRSSADVREEGSSWTAAFEASTFSPYIAKIIQNIHVEHECRDAKTESEQLRR
ncbi:hypothetical protein K488DRAFT_55359, partial [Vararia minispora EC-137]